MKLPFVMFVLLIVGILPVHAQNSPGIEGIIAPGSKLEKISGDLTFNAPGALCWDNGMLYFADIDINAPKENRTYRMASDGKIEVIQENNGIIMSIRSSGKGTLYCSELRNHRIIEMDGAGKVLGTVAKNFKGDLFEGPIGLAVDAKGGIYFADTQYYYRTINYLDMNSGIYYRTPDGQIKLVVEKAFCPWALAFSPDGAELYVAFIGGDDGGKAIFTYDIQPDGALKNTKRFGELAITDQNDALDITWKSSICFAHTVPNPASSGASGCAVDTFGNLYVATNQGFGIQVFSPSGVHIGNIGVASAANDCCFGGPDMKTLFVAAKDGIYRINTINPGLKIVSY